MGDVRGFRKRKARARLSRYPRSNGSFVFPARLSVSIAPALLCVGLLTWAGAPASQAQTGPSAPNPAEAIKAGDLPEAGRQARRRAEAGETESQFMLSLFLWHGVAMPQNFEEAMRWVTLAAVSGERKALNARSAMLKTLEPQVAQKSMDWVRTRLMREAEAGDNAALLRLAVSYSQTFGFANPLEAYFWSNLAVSNGRIEARKQRDAILPQLKPADLLKTQERARAWDERWRVEASAQALAEPAAPQPRALSSAPESEAASADSASADNPQGESPQSENPPSVNPNAQPARPETAAAATDAKEPGGKARE